MAVTDETLIRQYRDGRREAGESLLARLRPAIAAVCWATCGNAAIVEDAVQETCLRLLKGLPGYRDGSPVRPWAYQIARNCVRDMLRRRDSKVGIADVPEPAAGTAPETRLIAKEQSDRVARLIAELSPALREVVVMKYALDLDNDAIAETLGITMEALWARLSRARRELRERAHDDPDL